MTFPTLVHPASFGSGRIEAKTNHLRFIRRDGHLILQQAFEVVDGAIFTEWRDVPVADEPQDGAP